MPKAPEDPQSWGVGCIKGKLGSPRRRLLSLYECEFGLQRHTQTTGHLPGPPHPWGGCHGAGDTCAAQCVLGGPFQPGELGQAWGNRRTAGSSPEVPAGPRSMCYRGDTELGGEFSLQELPGQASLWGCAPCLCVPIPRCVSPHAFLLSPPSSDCTAGLATPSACLLVPVLPSLSLSFSSCPRSFSVSWFHGVPPCLSFLLCGLSVFLLLLVFLPLSLPLSFCLSLVLSYHVCPSLHVEVCPEWHWVPSDAWPSLCWASRADLKFLEAIRPRLLVVVLLGQLTSAPPRKTMAQ